MRLRDRRALLAALILAAAYGALLTWGLAWSVAWLAHRPLEASIPLSLIIANLSLLGWRMIMRMAITHASHGWRIALLTPLHMVIGNIVSMMAAVRALGLYAGLVHHGRLRWDKTAHVFPSADAGR
jgi:adsorption protein B